MGLPGNDTALHMMEGQPQVRVHCCLRKWEGDLRSIAGASPDVLWENGNAVCMYT